MQEISEARSWPISFLKMWIGQLESTGALKKDSAGRYKAVADAQKKLKSLKRKSQFAGHGHGKRGGSTHAANDGKSRGSPLR